MLERGRIVAIGSRDLAGEVRKPLDLKRAHILLHRGMPNAFREWSKSIGLPDLEPAEVTYFDAGQLILDAAAGGLGIAFMFESASRLDGRGACSILRRSGGSPYA